MPRLLRPHIPLETRCRVVLRQLGEIWPDGYLASRRTVRQSDGVILRNLLVRLAELLACTPEDLRLDHDPALAMREKVFKKGKHVGYIPDANDPASLLYREKHAHHIKTQVRGDGAQHPDRVYIKRARRREKAAREKKQKPFKRHVAFQGKNKAPKRPWPKGRKIQSRGFT